MRRLVTTTAVIGLLMASAVRAQDDAFDASTVVATVNGTEITLGHVIMMRDRLPQQFQSVPDADLFPGLIEQLVDQTLLSELTSEGPDSDPLEVRVHLDNERRGTLAALAVQERIDGPLDEAKVQAAYDEAFKDFAPQPEFNAAHILVDSEEKAGELKAGIDGGDDFATVAQANSSDGSAANGGGLGWFGKGQMVPEFEAAVLEMEPGEVVGPVQTQFGWHLIMLNETRESERPALEGVREQIEGQLRQEDLNELLTGLREGAEIDRPETEIPAEAIRDTGLLGIN